jgi:predicted nucleic acid-binding Zn ribbon protein
MEKQKRSCAECSTSIQGRSDKKFCSDACRNIYNNRLNSETSSLVRRVNFALRKNRRILSELRSGRKTKVNRDQLVLKGFNFEHYTKTATVRSGEICFYCYDQGYLFLGNEKIELVQDLGE